MQVKRVVASNQVRHCATYLPTYTHTYICIHAYIYAYIQAFKNTYIYVKSQSQEAECLVRMKQVVAVNQCAIVLHTNIHTTLCASVSIMPVTDSYSDAEAHRFCPTRSARRLHLHPS